ncbi:MAG TPA: protease pro-enzyme activation domain-containing protein, partial [Candidatus Acidoferrales bacterium]|nr:protease pro-enzyme activation domain-containing protein [Candidatus Acidoferrales bacterium]
MRRTSRVIATALGLSLALSACSGQHSSLLPTTPGDASGPDNSVPVKTASSESANSIHSVNPLISVPHTFGALAFSDAGRRPANASVGVTLLLRYNDQAGLDRFVEQLGNERGKRNPLTPAQFNARFAPTAKQEQAVIHSLEKAGFTITQRFSNRTIVDAKAPSSVVERYFATEIHTVNQGKYGQRFTNVKPATVPREISQYVRDASLNNVVIARTGVDQAGGIGKTNVTAIPGTKSGAGQVGQELPMFLRPRATGCTGQILLNPGFESGNVNWSTTSGVINNDSSLSYQGSWEAWMDGYTSAETDTLQQTAAIPAGCTATLTYHLYIYTTDGTTAKDTLKLTVNGTTEQSFSNANASSGYVTETVNLSSFAGTNAAVLWTSKQTGTRATDFFIDSVALTLSGGTATPTPSPAPTATPTAAPTATPHPTPTPTGAPTATPHPTPTPTTAPTATPVPTPTPGGGCNGAAPLNGPLTNSSGTLATGVAKPFDFPVQHGCNGAGYTAAIAIDDAVNTSYVTKYLTAAGVTETGTITNTAVDGGGTADDAETDLDVQTIAGLAPGANIIVYDMGSLADQNIEDAYN